VLIAVSGGIAAAVFFTVSALCATSSSREIGAASTLAWVMSLGLCMIVVPLAVMGQPNNLPGTTIALLCLAGATNILGLLLEYVVLRRVAVGIVTAIASTEGMMAAVLSSVFGAPLGTSTVVLLVAITAGVVLAAAHLDPPSDASLDGATPGSGPGATRVRDRFDRSLTRSALLVVPVAVLFGVTLYATGRAGTEAPLIWVLLPARVMGTVFIAAPLATRRKLKITRRTFPLVLIGGAGEVVGLICYIFAARHQLAVAAVLASQYAAITPVAAFFLFGERLRRHQVVGIVIVIAGVVTLSALGA
jgi:drug/metabolite transporter (DMT)-like permease